ncbi:MAG TPA: hypothetical protein IAC53_03800 [Candidatus Fimenecus excrementigallinarum]|uniref:DUF1273 domain-containing protein n=1 Tax=Candidatus Fimenecus excrementigallinarum TaxID=2840816 RepID=A0A9D1IH38_9FIRM|nr:hypothetical protein [Candidatus Fimenecus excrementigallinarum]
MTCTFFGHRDVPPELEPVLQAALTQLTERRQVCRFLVGNQGGFDRMALRVLRRLCKTHPGLQVSVVLAYNPGRLPPRAAREDNTWLFPEALENVPPRFAIDRRNRWMLSQAEYVVTFVQATVGGAAKYRALALRQGKRVLDLAARVPPAGSPQHEPYAEVQNAGEHHDEHGI